MTDANTGPNGKRSMRDNAQFITHIEISENDNRFAAVEHTHMDREISCHHQMKEMTHRCFAHFLPCQRVAR